MEEGTIADHLEKAGFTSVETVNTQWHDAPPELQIPECTVYKGKELSSGRSVLLLRYPKTEGGEDWPQGEGFLPCLREFSVENEAWRCKVFATSAAIRPLVQLVRHQHAMLRSVTKLNVLDNDCLFALLNALVKTCVSAQSPPNAPLANPALAALHPEQVLYSLSPSGLQFQWLPIPDSLLPSPNIFLAPELRNPSTQASFAMDSSCDLWTIGAILLFLSVHVVLPSGSCEIGWSLSSQLDKVISNPVQRQHWRDYVSEDLRQIILGCLCPQDKRITWQGLQSLCHSPRRLANSLRHLSLRDDKPRNADERGDDEEDEDEAWEGDEEEARDVEEDEEGEEEEEGTGPARRTLTISAVARHSRFSRDHSHDAAPRQLFPLSPPKSPSSQPLTILTDAASLAHTLSSPSSLTDTQSPSGGSPTPPPRTLSSFQALSPFSSISSPGLSPLSQSSHSVCYPSPSPPKSASSSRRPLSTSPVPSPSTSSAARTQSQARFHQSLSHRAMADLGAAEINMLYYRATTLHCAKSLQQLLTLASPLHPTPQPLAVLFVMRIYAHGLGKLARDLSLAEDYCQRGKSFLVEHIHRAATSKAVTPPDILKYMYFLYSTFFAHGLGGEAYQPSRAIHYCELSAVLGYSSASNYLGYCYKVGELVEKNGLQSLHYYRQAAEAGHAMAQWQLATWYEHGKLDVGLSKDPQLAFHYWELSAQQGHYLSLNCLGNLYYLGKPPVARDYARAARYYQASAQAGNYYLAFNNLASCHYYGEGVRRSWKKAVFYYRKAACHPPYYAPAQYNYAVCLEYGEGIEQNIKEAMHYYALSAEQGYREAQYTLARHYECGTNGLETNFLKAIHYYKAAADQGHAESRLSVQRLLR